MIKQICTLLLLSLLLLQCSKEEPENPYDDLVYPVETVDTSQLPAQSLLRLHQDVLFPTCANSGCHDGSFEPDFRTPQSTYNTTVGHLASKPGPNGDRTLRVEAGAANLSMLIYRLEQDLENSSGLMPLAVEPDSDWPAKQAQYIEDIKAWINAGALNTIDG